jgi:hypothetical protein
MEEQRLRREMYGRLTTDLPEDLDLDETQREQFRQVLESQREQFRSRWQSMRSLWDEIRAAQASGDQGRIDELREQIDQMRPDPEQMAAAFFQQVEGLLRDEQKAVLARYREEFGLGGAQGARGSGDVRVVLRAARRLRLSGEQRDTLKQIEREAMKARREISRRDREAQVTLADRVEREIRAMLDEDQAREFEEHLKRLERGGRGRANQPPRAP